MGRRFTEHLDMKAIVKELGEPENLILLNQVSISAVGKGFLSRPCVNNEVSALFRAIPKISQHSVEVLRLNVLKDIPANY